MNGINRQFYDQASETQDQGSQIRNQWSELPRQGEYRAQGMKQMVSKK